MSALEIGYRIIEQLRRRIDGAHRVDWRAFGNCSGPVEGFPGLNGPAAIDAATLGWIDAEAHAAIAGRFTLLGQHWPRPRTGELWWNSDLWLTDPVSGLAWPGAEKSAFAVPYRGESAKGDVKFVWELNRLQFLPSIALHALLTGDTAAASALILDVLRGWMRANPPYRGVNWTSGIEAASRVVSLLAALSFAPTLRDEAAVRAFLNAHVTWIARYPSRFSSANNHRIAELCALFLAALSVQGFSASAARARAGLEREMLRQIHADGVPAEQSAAYAAYSLEWFVLAGLAGDAAGRPFSQAFKDRARLALDYLCWLMDDVGQTPCIGDGDQSRVIALTQAPEPHYIASVAAMAARWLKAPEPFADRRDFALRDLLGDPTQPAIAPMGRRTFPRGGLTIWRRPTLQGTLLAVFDHGPLGYRSIAAHGHADALALWLHWGEEAVFSDPGTYLYHTPGAVRGQLRGSGAHNTLTIADQDQSRMIGPFAWADHARVRLLNATDEEAEAEHDGYRRRFGLTHRRKIRLDGYAILIEDRLVGRPRRAGLPWSLGFTLTPDASVITDGSRATVVTPAGGRLHLLCEVTQGPSPSWAVAPTPYAPAFGVLRSTSRLQLTGVIGPSPLMIRTNIIIETRPPYHDKPS